MTMPNPLWNEKGSRRWAGSCSPAPDLDRSGVVYVGDASGRANQELSGEVLALNGKICNVY